MSLPAADFRAYVQSVFACHQPTVSAQHRLREFPPTTPRIRKNLAMTSFLVSRFFDQLAPLFGIGYIALTSRIRRLIILLIIDVKQRSGAKIS